MFRVLHIGSHFGNIGDNASHSVVQDAITQRVQARFDNLEIRRFYRNAGELEFDAALVRCANTYDLVLFGGGNFLEPVHAYSSTATTLDLSPERMDELKVPFVCNAVSFDPAKLEHGELLERFSVWAEAASANPNVMVNLRDDGSKDDFERLVGPLSRFGFGLVPDPGLFYTPPHVFPFTSRNYLAVNLAGDLEEVRYPRTGDKDALFAALRGVIRHLPDDMGLVLVPHVAQDVTIIGEFLKDCTHWASRRRILVAPLLQGYDDFWKTWSLYQKASGIIANRFHSLVCNIQHGRPMTVLANYPKMAKTLSIMGLDDLSYAGGGSSELLARLVRGGDGSRQRRQALVKEQRTDFETSIDEIVAFAGG